MHTRSRTVLVSAAIAATFGLGVGLVAGRRPAPPPAPVPSEAATVAAGLSDHYAALQRVADSVAATQSAADAGPSELAQVTARNLAGRIRAVAGDYETLSIAMTAADYERGDTLWMRLAIAQAALEMLQEDAARLGDSATTGPADVRDLADQLSGVLELGRTTGREASRTFGPHPQRRPPSPRPEFSS